MSMATRKWSNLSARHRKLIIVAAVAEGSLKTLALIDLKRRPEAQIRGAKWGWGLGIALFNSFGAAPLAYFAFGRLSG
jgi:hypothetical protein